MTQILVFGDSIAYGCLDSEGGWVERLKKSIPNSIIYNLGVSGDTTEDLLARFEHETKQRIKGDEDVIFIFAIGINDSAFIQNNSFWVPPEKFERNIRELIHRAQKFSQKIVFVGLTPVDEEITAPVPWNTDIYYKNDNIRKYDAIIKSTCSKNHAAFIEILEKWKKLGYEKLLEDGAHPNPEGHKRIFKSVSEFLVERKIINIS